MNISPVRVTIFAMEYGPRLSGGVGTHVADLAKGLGRLGCEVTVLAYTPDAAATFQDGEAEIHLVPASSRNASNMARRSMVDGILAFNDDLIAYHRTLINGRGQKPDVIHYHNWITFRAANNCAQELGSALVGTVHFLCEPIERWWGSTPDPQVVQQEREQFRQPHTIISVSHSLQKIVRSAHEIAEDQAHVVHNGLDSDSFMKSQPNPAAVSQLRNAIADPKEKVVIFAGRLHAMKGVTSLLDSAARVIDEYQDVRYILAGEPDSRDYAKIIEATFDKHPALRGKVKLLGRVPRQQLSLLYRIADIAVVPSVYEPFGYAAIEAMSASLPVVATDVGGLGEIVQHEQTGLLVPIRPSADGTRAVDAEQLAAAQVCLLKDESKAKKFGQAARRRLLDLFTLEKMARSTLDVYQKAISKKTANARSSTTV